MPVAGSRSSGIDLLLAPRKSLLGVAKLGGDAPLLVGIPAPGEEQSGAGGNEEKDLRHG